MSIIDRIIQQTEAGEVPDLAKLRLLGDLEIARVGEEFVRHAIHSEQTQDDFYAELGNVDPASVPTFNPFPEKHDERD